MNKDIVRKARFGDAVDAVEAKKCPFCAKPINDSDFKNDVSRREYEISGICQKCQDKTFGKDKEEDEEQPEADDCNNYTIQNAPIICSSAEAEKRRFRMVTSKSGERWLIAIEENCADHV